MVSMVRTTTVHSWPATKIIIAWHRPLGIVILDVRVIVTSCFADWRLNRFTGKPNNGLHPVCDSSGEVVAQLSGGHATQAEGSGEACRNKSIRQDFDRVGISSWNENADSSHEP